MLRHFPTESSDHQWLDSLNKNTSSVDEIELQEKINHVLTNLLEKVNRNSGLIYCPSGFFTEKPLWITKKLSAELKQQITVHSGPLYEFIKNAAAGKRLPGSLSTGIAACLPIVNEKHLYGVFLMEGNPIDEAQSEQLQNGLDELASYFWKIESEKIRTEQENQIEVLKNIARLQSASLDINDIQLGIVQNIRKVFQAEEAILVILDRDNPDLVIKKRLSFRPDWISQVSQKLEEGLIWQCVYTKKMVEKIDIDQCNLFNPQFDGALGLHVQSMICVPLISNGKILGALALMNQPARELDSEKIDLLESMTTALANAMSNMNTVLELRVSNADLEARRWELFHSRNTLRTLFDNIPASIYIIDRKYTLLAINMSRSTRAGEPPQKQVGRKCYEKLYSRSDPCPGCRAMETFNAGRSTSRLNRQWLSDEEFIEWEITTYPIINEDDYPIQTILLEQDVTEKRHLEANLIQSEKLAAVGQLAAGLAHEINNPLAAIIANAQLLSREVSKDEVDLLDSLKLIEIAGTRASQVVKNLLGFARKEQYDFGVVDLNETVHNALSLVQHEINTRPIQVKLDLEENLPRVTASRDHLQGVWINLVMNAIDALENEPGEIQIMTRFQNSEFRIVVSDTGKGVSPEKLPRLFEPFYTTKSAGRGTGLGLSVCHRIIKQHGGTITAESKLGKGTKFIIALPASANLRELRSTVKE